MSKKRRIRVLSRMRRTCDMGHCLFAIEGTGDRVIVEGLAHLVYAYGHHAAEADCEQRDVEERLAEITRLRGAAAPATATAARRG